MEQSEFDIIDRYFATMGLDNEAIVIGPGDDCAVLSMPSGSELCVSTDSLLADVHFPADATGQIVASRTVGASVSDLAAMGARPYACLLALSMPEVNTSWLDGFASTLLQQTRRYDIPLAGGNLARGRLSLTMTVLGVLPIGTALTRSGAQSGDDIYVTGTLGDAGLGLRSVLAGDFSSHCALRYTEPTPRTREAEQLRGVASAAIDISDGFIADLGHLAKASGLGAEIRIEKLPLSGALLDSVGLDEARSLALSAGDDYELCFTAPGSVREQIQNLSSSLELPMTCIGEMTHGDEIRLLDPDGNLLPLSNIGYQHF